jgi:hypothetical protein
VLLSGLKAQDLFETAPNSSFVGPNTNLSARSDDFDLRDL